MSDTVTVTCANIYHRGTTVEVDDEEREVSFDKDRQRGVAVAEVPAEVAAALAKKEAYAVEEPLSEPGLDAPSVLDGIGPAYEEELAEADVEKVAGLANADAEILAAELSADEETVFEWISAAKAHE